MREFRADEATVARLCARFGLGSQGGRLTPAAEGAMGRIWRMDLDDGRRYAVKELFWEWEESAAVRECDFATLSGVRTPRFFRTIDGTLFDRLPSTLGGAVVRLFSWVDGRETLPGDPGRSRWFGDALGRLHTLDLSPQGWSSHPWYDTCSPPERWKELLDRLWADRLSWAAQRLRDLLPLLTEIARSVTPNDPKALAVCHRDFGPNNVLADGTEDGYTLLDWENAGLCVPARELAGGLFDWHVHDGRIDEDGVRETLEAYRRAGGEASLEDLSDFSTVFAAYLNYLEVLLAQRLGTEPSHTTTSALDGRIRTQFDSAPSPAVADRLLHLAR